VILIQSTWDNYLANNNVLEPGPEMMWSGTGDPTMELGQGQGLGLGQTVQETVSGGLNSNLFANAPGMFPSGAGM